MKALSKCPFAAKIVVSIVFFSLIVVIGVTYQNQGKASYIFSADINSYKSTNDALEESIDNYKQENEQLKQTIATTQQEVDDWRSYADGLSAQIIYVPEYHEQTITKEVEVDKPVYINNEWREFESPAVLMSWAKDHLATLWIVGNQIADCDDYAERLQLEAFKAGYLLSLQLIEDGILFGKNVSNFQEPHMGNIAMIGNEIYFIEPQPDYFRIVYVCDRD
jgi:hypothetical protein